MRPQGPPRQSGVAAAVTAALAALTEGMEYVEAGRNDKKSMRRKFNLHIPLSSVLVDGVKLADKQS